MSSRYNVNVNNFSSPFSTQVNTSAARNEERRLERIYGGALRPQRSQLEEAQDDARAYSQKMALVANEKIGLATSQSSAHVNFGGHHYVLPPVRSQTFGVIKAYGDFDAHFGGLRISKAMMNWHRNLLSSLGFHNTDAKKFNANAADKANGGLFRKKSAPPILVPILPYDNIQSLFNRKLAQARVAARIEINSNNETVLIHPSSESGDLLGEMKAWAREHWVGVEEKPWNDALLPLPTLNKKARFTQADAAQLEKDWRAFLSQ